MNSSVNETCDGFKMLENTEDMDKSEEGKNNLTHYEGFKLFIKLQITLE